MPKFQEATRRIAIAAVLLYCFCSTFDMFDKKLVAMFSLKEAAFPDSYCLMAAERLRATGQVYHDTTNGPYVPVVYSPLFFHLLAFPATFIQSSNPYIPARLAVLIVYLLCIALAGSLTQRLVRLRQSWILGVLLATSVSVMQGWVLQLRPDFPGVLFALLSIRLLLWRNAYAPILAGIAAGLALQFKISLIGALCAGCLWLLLRRRWQSAFVFGATGAVVGFGLYGLFAQSEPLMFQQMFTLVRVVQDYPGFFRIVGHVVKEPMVLFAVGAVVAIPIVRRSWDWRLLLIFLAISFVVATVSELQVGANTNYYHDSFLAAAPLATLAIYHLTRRRSHVAPGWRVAAALVLLASTPNAARSAWHLYNQFFRGKLVAENRAISNLESALRGVNFVSGDLRVSAMSPHPLINEPFTLSYMEAIGLPKPNGLYNDILSQKFDLAITRAGATEYRTIPHVAPSLRSSVSKSYVPFCSYEPMDIVVQIPRSRAIPSGETEKLTAIGCVPCSQSGGCSNW